MTTIKDLLWNQMWNVLQHKPLSLSKAGEGWFSVRKTASAVSG